MVKSNLSRFESAGLSYLAASALDEPTIPPPQIVARRAATAAFAAVGDLPAAVEVCGGAVGVTVRAAAHAGPVVGGVSRCRAEVLKPQLIGTLMPRYLLVGDAVAAVVRAAEVAPRRCVIASEALAALVEDVDDGGGFQVRAPCGSPKTCRPCGQAAARVLSLRR
jgi:hypothetical protein